MTRKDARIYLGEMLASTRSTTGYPRGQDITPDSPVQNTVNSSLVIEGIDFTAPIRTNPVVSIAGAQQILGRVVLPASDYGTPAWNLPYLQDIFNSIFVRNNTIDSATLGRHTTGENAQQDEFVPSFLRFMVRVQDEVTGAESWENITFLNSRSYETSPGNAGRVTGDVENPNPFGYAAAVSPSTRVMSGALITSLSIGSRGGFDTMITTISDNRTHVVNVVMDGIETTFTLPYLPLSADVTGTGANILTINGVPTSFTSVSITTGLVTLDAAGSAADEVCMDYETNYIAP